MGNLTNLDQIVAGSWFKRGFNKLNIAAVAGFDYSLLTAAGMPGAATAPATGSGNSYLSSSVGAMPVPGALDTGDDLYLALLSACGSVAGTLTIYDRLWATSGLSGVLNTAQTINTGTLPRYTDGQGVELFLEWYTATGVTQVTATCNYTNEKGTTGRVSPALTVAASTPANRMLQVPLLGTDKGVRSVESLTLSATTGTAGNFGVTLLKKIADIPLSVANIGNLLDIIGIGKVSVADATANLPALFFMFRSSNNATGLISGQAGLLSA